MGFKGCNIALRLSLMNDASQKMTESNGWHHDGLQHSAA